jgi:arginine exporter protein ArgO
MIGLGFVAGTFAASLLFFISSSLIIRIVLRYEMASARSYPLLVGALILMISVHLQYSAILHGKELHHE